VHAVECLGRREDERIVPDGRVELLGPLPGTLDRRDVVDAGDVLLRVGLFFERTPSVAGAFKQFETTTSAELVRRWSFDVKAGRDWFFISTRQSSRREGLWIVKVNPGGLREALALARAGTAQPLYSNVLKICREIHEYLAKSPDVAAIRWYFRRVREPFTTPDELLADKYRKEGWRIS
jgi:hypothetical protein